MASTLLRATQRDQRPHHPPYAWVAGHDENGDTLSGRVIVQVLSDGRFVDRVDILVVNASRNLLQERYL